MKYEDGYAGEIRIGLIEHLPVQEKEIKQWSKSGGIQSIVSLLILYILLFKNTFHWIQNNILMKSEEKASFLLWI